MDKKEYIEMSVYEAKNIITALSGYSEFIAMEMAEGSVALEMAENINRMSRFMAEFVEKKMLYEILRDHLYQINPVTISFSALFERVMEETALQKAKPKIHICGEQQLEVRGDEKLLRALLFHLLDNAWKYGDKQEIQVNIEEREEGTLFTVSNRAAEIEEEQIGRLTEPFYRVDKRKSRMLGGQGMGLAIVALIVENIQAQLDFRSREGMFQASVLWKLR